MGPDDQSIACGKQKGKPPSTKASVAEHGADFQPQIGITESEAARPEENFTLKFSANLCLKSVFVIALIAPFIH